MEKGLGQSHICWIYQSAAPMSCLRAWILILLESTAGAGAGIRRSFVCLLPCRVIVSRQSDPVNPCWASPITWEMSYCLESTTRNVKMTPSVSVYNMALSTVHTEGKTGWICCGVPMLWNRENGLVQARIACCWQCAYNAKTCRAIISLMWRVFFYYLFTCLFILIYDFI